jgi:capsular exopolysaccharide synthesis family protein
MEPLLQTASQSQTRPDARSSSAFSAAVKPWSETDGNLAVGHGSVNRELRLRNARNDRDPITSRRIDHSKIVQEVIMAQRLSRQEEKSLHFIIQRYRLLCNRMVEVARNLGSQVFLITSALADEGKTLTTTNLAFALSAIENKRTLLIDLDLRRFTLHSMFGLHASKDEEHFLLAGDWHDSRWFVNPGLDVLLATKAAEQPDALLHSIAMRNLLDAARLEYDYILIDSAPLLLAADTHALLPIIDQAMLVVRADATPIPCSQDALKILGDKAVGCILNDVKRLKYESYYHGYYGTNE